MASKHIPQKVLGQQLAETIKGRRVRTAVFTTYTFDPGFFESHILPILFPDKPFHQVEKVHRIQMEDAIRSLDDIAVYYDRTALSQDAQPAQLDFRRIDVRRATGAFHSKLILLLVENRDDNLQEDSTPPDLSLIVASLSANLTRAGWWKNVETGHIDEVCDRNHQNSRTSIRGDILSMIQRLKRCCVTDENHSALDRIHDFLIKRVNTNIIKNITINGRYSTRLFCGQSDLPTWLKELKIDRHHANLEIISPYFDKTPAGTLKKLIDATAPQSVRIFLPRNVDGSAGVSEKTFKSVNELGNVKWAYLPDDILRPGGRKNIDKLPPRRVHAKVYRFWMQGGPNITLAGSVNLTSAGHSHSNAGNLESAFLYDITTDGFANRWWLEPLEKPPKTFDEKHSDETDKSQNVPLDISFRYNWAENKIEYRAEGMTGRPIAVCEPSGICLFEINSFAFEKWIDCGKEAAEKVRQLLASTSFLEIHHRKGKWRVLIREEGMNHRPSLLISLTPEEILMYWSLLSPAQQEYFLTEKLAGGATLQGLMAGNSNRYIINDTVFDRFSGVYHAFEQLINHVNNAIAFGRENEAESRLFGAKYDSLPVLLEKTISREDGDDIMNYIKFLCARQAKKRVATAYPKFMKAHTRDVRALNRLLDQQTLIRKKISPQIENSAPFLDWYEKIFLSMIEQPNLGEDQ
jgi:hypothetical protein